MRKDLMLVTCALGTIVFQFAPAASTPPAPAAPNIVPVTVAPTAPRERNVITSDTAPALPLDVPSATRGAVEPSTLDREIGTASDGGYIYYGVERR